MTREEKDECLKSIQQCKIDCSGDIDGFTKWEVDKLLNQIFDEHEVQLKAKDKEIAELKWDFDTQKKSAIEAYSKNEDIDMLNESASNFFYALIDERKQRFYIFDCLKKERKKAREIVAMLFWEWRKKKEDLLKNGTKITNQ